MMSGIAGRVKRLIADVSGVVPVEVTDVHELPAGGIDYLIVGRQHRSADGNIDRLGHEIVLDAVEHTRPSALIYVVPAEFGSQRYPRDHAVLLAASRIVPTYVLEFSRLIAMDEQMATSRARSQLARAGKPDERGVVRLLGPLPRGRRLD